MKYVALGIPGITGEITPPAGVPTGGLTGVGRSIVQTGVSLLFIVAVIFALGYILFGGFKWMTSGGDQEKLAGARQTITYAIIGLAIVALSFTVINVIDAFLHPTQCLLCLFKASP